MLGLTDSVMVGAALVGSLVAPGLAAATGPRALLAGLAVVAVAAVPAVARARSDAPAVRMPRQRRPEAALRRTAQRAGTDSRG